MELNTRTWLVAVMLTIAGAAHAQGVTSTPDSVGKDARYAATAAESTIKALVSRWAEADGMYLEWKSPTDLPIGNFQALNRVAKLPAAKTFGEAFSRLSDVVDQEQATTGRPQQAKLVACVSPFGVEVRTIVQPPCGVALDLRPKGKLPAQHNAPEARSISL